MNAPGGLLRKWVGPLNRNERPFGLRPLPSMSAAIGLLAANRVHPYPPSLKLGQEARRSPPPRHEIVSALAIYCLPPPPPLRIVSGPFFISVLAEDITWVLQGEERDEEEEEKEALRQGQVFIVQV